MKTELFDFQLPESLIADRPANPRDSSRMLVVGEVVRDDAIRNITQYLKPGDVMVFNDTRVLPARLMGKRNDAKIEILLHKRTGDIKWQCFAKPAKKLKAGDAVIFAPDFAAEVESKSEDGQVILHFVGENNDSFTRKLEQYGAMPLPPYIERKRKADKGDADTYQTIYAKADGSVAAPTAGLHFTKALLAAIDAAGVKRIHVTLHVGGGTFLPVKVEDTDDHLMHSEWAHVPLEAAHTINEAKAKGGRIIAVGTTSLRTLESAADAQGYLQSFTGDTAIFITPGYRFKLVDMLLTNFHLPKSTLFMLVCALAGTEQMQAAYAHAIAQHYRFYSYGDACLIAKRL